MRETSSESSSGKKSFENKKNGDCGVLDQLVALSMLLPDSGDEREDGGGECESYMEPKKRILKDKTSKKIMTPFSPTSHNSKFTKTRSDSQIFLLSENVGQS